MSDGCLVRVPDDVPLTTVHDAKYRVARVKGSEPLRRFQRLQGLNQR